VAPTTWANRIKANFEPVYSPRKKRSAGARRTFSGPDRTWGLGGGDQEKLFRVTGDAKEPTVSIR
jgi:hypothetical protein